MFISFQIPGSEFIGLGKDRDFNYFDFFNYFAAPRIEIRCREVIKIIKTNFFNNYLQSIREPPIFKLAEGLKFRHFDM